MKSGDSSSNLVSRVWKGLESLENETHLRVLGGRKS